MPAVRLALFAVLLAGWLFSPHLAVAQAPASGKALQGENLLANIPSGYKVGFEDRKKGMTMTEWVPTAQSVKDWSEMLTIQVFHGAPPPNLTPLSFRATMVQNWTKACAGSTAQPIRDGTERGYQFAFWVMSCPKSTMTGKPEITFFKAMRGTEGFYVIQQAFTAEPSKEQIEGTSRYMARVTLCDSRVAARPCPTVK